MFPVALLRRRARYVILAGVGGLFPDLDVLFHIHRSFSHTLVIPVVLALAGLLLSRHRRGRYGLLAFSFGWLLHVLLDLFTGYTPLLWPIWTEDVQLVFRGDILVSEHITPTIQAHVLTSPSAAETPFATFRGPLFTAEGLVAFLLILGAAAVMMRKKKALQVR